jgi:acyl carrier protein
MATATERLKQVFIQSLNLDPKTDFSTVVYAQTKGWDSIAHMTLVAAIEAEFGIMMETDDVIAMSSFSKAREMLAKYDVAMD